MGLFSGFLSYRTQIHRRPTVAPILVNGKVSLGRPPKNLFGSFRQSAHCYSGVALPASNLRTGRRGPLSFLSVTHTMAHADSSIDRKSIRLNSSHLGISY